LDAPPAGWRREELECGLAQTIPIVTGMAKVAPMLKAAQALKHYQGGHLRHVGKDKAKDEDPDVRLNHMRPQRLRGANYGRGPGYIITLTGRGKGWDDVSTGRTVDSQINRFTNDPFEDTPRLHTAAGRKFISKTKWDKRRSGSQ